MLKVVADENIPLLLDFFADIAIVEMHAGRTLNRDLLQGVDALLIRSVTPVNADLLQGSCVRFVGSCTIGTDHMNLQQLHDLGIDYASAPGCNANSVVDYVLSALCALDTQNTGVWMQKTVGIVGMGDVGSRLHQRLQDLGVHCLTCDPFRQKEAGFTHTPLDHLLTESDIISLHTPLTHQGEQATYHLLNAERLKRLREGVVLINSSRGGVIDEQALYAYCQKHPEIVLVLDVWEHEPQVDYRLLPYVALATPHIAGYSLEGKCAGTAMIYQKLCESFAISPKTILANILPKANTLHLHHSTNPYAVLNQAVAAVYDIRIDHAAFCKMMQSHQSIAKGFDGLRKEYPLRREFASGDVAEVPSSPQAYRLLKAAGFKVT